MGIVEDPCSALVAMAVGDWSGWSASEKRSVEEWEFMHVLRRCSTGSTLTFTVYIQIKIKYQFVWKH